ncbi:MULTISPECIES: outer membrane protein assembly factor BamA [Sulfurimonas]|uniref:Outer membrane protein assembly factor BamA n=1 Tax=Sulfurimonas diazotrophicus TaxID=3131939 RepID=A0ABZ3HAT4_9BACT
MKQWSALIAVFLTAATLAFAAETVEKVQFEGLVHISEGVAEQLLVQKAGTPLETEKVDKTIERFFGQGYFTDIYATYDAGVLTLHFTEKPVISRIELKGWKEKDEDTLKDVVQLKKGTLYDPKKLEAAKKRIVDNLSQEGKIDSVVEIETEHLDNGSVAVTFVVNEGETILIKKLNFSGVEGLDPDVFDENIANKEHQFMGWFWGRNDGKMMLDQLQYDPMRIRDTYMQHGYMDAKVDAPFTRIDFDDYTAEMSYQVSEGQVYITKAIELHQQTHVIDDAVLRDVITLETEQPFNIKTFRDDAERIKTKIADLGYAYVRVLPDLRKDKEHGTLEVVYRIIPGEKVWIRNVVISGNNRTLDRIVRRELYLGPGDLYSLTDLKDSRNALGRTGYFDANTIEEKRVDDHSMDLVVKVKEAPTGNIQLGGGYGSYGGFMLSVGVNDRNIFGSGITTGLRLERSQRSNNYSFNISNPRLNDSDFSGNFSIFYSDFQYNDYTTHSDGVSLGTGHRFSRYISGFLNYTYSNVNYRDVNLSLYAQDQQRFFESYAKSAVSVAMSFDNTDDYYVARSGWAISESIERAGLGAQANYVKSRTELSKYNGLDEWLGFDLIFRYKARYYLARDTGYLPLAERFYMGGLGSVRGYESYSMPYYRNAISGDNVRLGGKQTFSHNAELSFPLAPKAKMRLTTFLDWGWIGTSSLSEFSRGGYGVSLEWFSPMGPLQLVFANPINPETDDRISHFEFTIGQRF